MSNLLEVQSCFFLLAAGACARLQFWHSIFWLDLVTAIITVDAAFRGLGRGHWRVDGNLALLLQISLHVCDELLMLLRREPFLDVHKIIFKPRNWVALSPIVEHRLGNIISSVVDGVAFHTHHLGFDECWTFAPMRALGGFMGGVIN